MGYAVQSIRYFQVSWTLHWAIQPGSRWWYLPSFRGVGGSEEHFSSYSMEPTHLLVSIYPTGLKSKAAPWWGMLCCTSRCLLWKEGFIPPAAATLPPSTGNCPQQKTVASPNFMPLPGAKWHPMTGQCRGPKAWDPRPAGDNSEGLSQLQSSLWEWLRLLLCPCHSPTPLSAQPCFSSHEEKAQYMSCCHPISKAVLTPNTWQGPRYRLYGSLLTLTGSLRKRIKDENWRSEAGRLWPLFPTSHVGFVESQGSGTLQWLSMFPTAGWLKE